MVEELRVAHYGIVEFEGGHVGVRDFLAGDEGTLWGRGIDTSRLVWGSKGRGGDGGVGGLALVRIPGPESKPELI